MRWLGPGRYLLRVQHQELPGGYVNRRKFIARRAGRRWLLLEVNTCWGPPCRALGFFRTLREAEAHAHAL
jgi:hypothetical protein